MTLSSEVWEVSMKSSILVLALIFASFESTYPQHSSRSTPPREHRSLDGELRDYNKEQKTGGVPAASSLSRLTSTQVNQLRADAEELAKLAQSIPPEVDQTTKGMLPKELSAKLHRIEKLAKHLRSSISQ
jgi:hypothetical protein